MKNKKKLIIVALFLAAIGMGIGYSILSQQLKIEGTVNLDNSFDVEITGIEALENSRTEYYTGIGGSNAVQSSRIISEIEKPTYTSTTANFNIRMEIDSSITYLVKIENKGNLMAIFDATELVKTGSEDIKVEMPVEIENVTLEIGESIVLPVVISYPYSENLQGGESTSVSITLNPRQVTSSDNEAWTISPYLTISDIDSSLIYRDKYLYMEAQNPTSAVGSYRLYLSIDGGEYEVVEATISNGHIAYDARSIIDSSPHTLKFRYGANTVSDDHDYLSNVVIFVI